MQYKVKFIYFDGKDVDLILDEGKLQDFFEKINAGQIYWADEKMKRGFWLNLEKIRYIEFFGIEAPQIEEPVDEPEQDNAGEGELPSEDGANPDEEGEPEPA